MNMDATTKLTPAYQTSDSITIVTPYGVISLDIF